MNIAVCFITLLLSPLSGVGTSPITPVNRLETISNDTLRLVFDLTISNGWHVYSTALPKGGPVSASIEFDTLHGAETIGDIYFTGNEIEQDDRLFRMKVRFFEKKVSFYQNVRITSQDYLLEGAFTYGACNDENCLPPQRIEFRHPTNALETTTTPPSNDITKIDGFDQASWAPQSYTLDGSISQRNGLWGLFLTSFLGGLIALFTPCVWPVIPMTVSFFLKRTSNRRKAVSDAIIYGTSIIAVYVALGLAITLIFGANALNALATNAIVNILFFLLLVVFALSFFGLFEIGLPSRWSTSTDHKASAAGLGGIFFMALTLTIVSFSCTGPIIGFLLVDAASTGSMLAPTIGMLGFSMAMAIPFTLFAMFPGWLNTMPKSGGWMDRVKVTLAFIELAFSLKFLSVADMAYGWGILPRDLFILLWLIMALLLGLYLIGLIGSKKSGRGKRTTPVGLAVGILSLAFALWLVPGLWGAPLKAISAFTPPMSTQIINKNKATVEPQFKDYNEALLYAKEIGKPLLIDFTGYGCVNCRKMEATVWSDSRVAQTIENEFVLVSLYVDDKTPLDGPISIMENGTLVKIRTVGDKWSLLQRYKFGANAQPFYVIVDGSGRLMAGPYTFNTNADSFLQFLNSAR